MNNIWSDKKGINVSINVLLFLVAINFFHYGQLLLPIICLILFVDNRFKFTVNNKTTFILLCLFGLTFFIFSYELGFYCVMGFCLPMAYYIGSNIKNPSKENIKRIIYLFAYGMIAHVFLNVIYTYSLLGTRMFFNQGHYDVWTKTKLAGTATAVNYIFIIGCIYYNIFYEDNKKIKIITSIVFVLAMIYNLFLGRRTPLFVLLISFILTGCIDLFILKKNKKAYKIALVFILSFVCASILLFVIYKNLKNPTLIIMIEHSVLVKKFKNEGLTSGRLEILIDTIKLMPYHLWGKEEISSIIGIRPHDLLTDIYNYAGIIPFIIMTVCAIQGIMNVGKKINKTDDNSFRLLLISLFIAIILQMMLEPVMTGSSLFLIIVILLMSVIEKYEI